MVLRTMSHFKGWVFWIIVNLYCQNATSNNDMAVLTALRDTIELSNSENPGSVSGISLSQSQKDAILQLHNAFRSMVKPTASNMLRMMWDEDLEKISTNFASKCIVAHNPDRHKLAKNYDWVGENIAWGTGTCGDKECGDVYEGVKRWFSESKSYNFLTGQCSGKCTLYTQMVWWESNKLGCGAKRCGDRTILVCNYAPGGNYVGQRPYKTGKSCSECPSGLLCEDNLCTETKKTETNPSDSEENSKTEKTISKPECQGDVSKKQSTGVNILLCPNLRGQTTISVEPANLPVMAIASNDHSLLPSLSSLPSLPSLPSGWSELPFHLSQVDSGISPYIVGINGKHEVFSFGASNVLKKIDGTMHHVSSGQSGVWSVGLLGNVFFRKGTEPDAEDLNSRENILTSFWEKIPGNLKQIDAGISGVVWGVNRYNRIFCRIGITRDRPEGTGWMRIEGNMKYVSCGEFGCWAVNKRDNVYFRVGITEVLPQGIQWTVVPGKLRMVESGPAGLTVGLSDTNDVFLRQGVTAIKPEGVKWVKLDLRLAHVTVGNKGIIGILPDGTVVIHRDVNSFVYQMPTIPPTNFPLVPSQESPLDAFTSPRPLLGFPNVNPETSQTLEESINSLQQLNPSALSLLNSGTPLDKEQLHISPDMAAKILKLIEQKGNQFEDSHKAAAAAAALSRNSSAKILNTVLEKNDDLNVPPGIAETRMPAKNASLDVLNKHFAPVMLDSHQTDENKPKSSLETKATSQETSSDIPIPRENNGTDPKTHEQATTASTTKIAQQVKTITTQRITSSVTPTTSQIQTTNSRSSGSKLMYPQPKLPHFHAVVVANVVKATPHTFSLITNTHSNWVHSLPPPPPSPPLSALLTENAKFAPLGQRVVAHSGSVLPTALPPTAVNAEVKHTFAAPHAEPTLKPTKSSLKSKVNLHKVILSPGISLAKTTQSERIPQLVHPVGMSLQMTRSCCAIPDSVCPIPKDCVGYIECHGNHGNYKSCERGKMFNPITNICDYPRNVDCDSTKVLTQNNAQTTSTTPLSILTPSLITTLTMQQAIVPFSSEATPIPPVVETTLLSNNAEPQALTISPQVVPFVAANTNPLAAPVFQVAPSLRDDTAKQVAAQPRVNRPHSDDDGVLREVWFGLGLSPLLTLLTNNPRFPTNPDEYIVLDKFEAPPNAGDGYGQRLSTYYKAPTTGEFIFYISCDNECELWISPDTEEIHSNLILELKHGHYTSYRQWHKYPAEQTSRPIFLAKDQYYFMESFMKEGTGGDDLSVGVQLPGGELDLPISKNLYLVPGDTSSDALTRKVGQSVLLPQPEQTVLNPQIHQQYLSQQFSAQPSAAQYNQPFGQPVVAPQPSSLSESTDYSSLNFQPIQTADQWSAFTNKQNREPGYSSLEQFAAVANNIGNIPGAEMYAHHDDEEPIEESNQHFRSSVKRNYIPVSNDS
ncbi:uncharacterized protein LOC100198409 isoform X1 [Hydra vulgaris]|uniref:Uncharacterized protein LOC100198409 isoform X1 n=1 Tax=Hydra vulgaris TaxID=6087 RepID=A0ABM4CIR8_HYDVU